MVPARLARVAPRLSGALLLALATGGCSTFDSFNPFGAEKYVTKPVSETPADQLYDQGLARLAKRDSSGAGKSFEQLRKEHPFTAEARKALILETFAQYSAGSYDDAIASANRFVQLYPQSPDVAYAYYLAGMSNYNQIPDISRDQERAERAVSLFTVVTTKFPQSEYAEDAKYKIGVANDQLAGKEMSIGRFYLGRKQYASAINRFRDVLSKYQTTRHSEEALERLTEAYLGLGVSNEAQTAAAVLGHNFPSSPWYKDAVALLENNGLRPEESEGSWISRTYRRIVG